MACTLDMMMISVSRLFGGQHSLFLWNPATVLSMRAPSQATGPDAPTVDAGQGGDPSN